MSIPDNIGSFPENITELILRFLDFDEYGRCASVSSALHRGCHNLLHRTERIRVSQGSCMEIGRGGAYKCLPILRLLEVSQCASDTLLHNLVGLVPNLSWLRCQNSPLLTDDGIGSLVVDPVNRLSLEEIDLTFCHNTTYGGTLQLRRALPGLKLIRRQPVWLDGHFVTPFGGSSIEEVHTYYADGSFDFSRREQSRGYVRYFEHKQFQDGTDSFLKDSLQYCNFDGADMGWPEFARFLYRPGVAVRQGQPAYWDTSGRRSVLVAQHLSGMHAPDVWPPIRDGEVPMGQSIYFDERGERLPTGLSMQDAIGQGAVSLISRMEVRPLEFLMPPSRLVEDIEAFEQLREAFERLLQPHGVEMMQMSLHHVLGGR